MTRGEGQQCPDCHHRTSIGSHIRHCRIYSGNPFTSGACQTFSEAIIMPVDARPTIAAPDDDPYLWLEEIDGERAVAWVDQQNGLTLAKFGTPRLCRGSRHARRHPRPAGQHSLRHAARAVPLQHLEGRHEPARPLASNHARQLPHRAAELGDPARRRCASGGRETKIGCGTAPRPCRARTIWRSCRCHAAAATPPCCASSTSPPRRS